MRQLPQRGITSRTTAVWKLLPGSMNTVVFVDCAGSSAAMDACFSKWQSETLPVT